MMENGLFDFWKLVTPVRVNTRLASLNCIYSNFDDVKRINQTTTEGVNIQNFATLSRYLLYAYSVYAISWMLCLWYRM